MRQRRKQREKCLWREETKTKREKMEREGRERRTIKQTKRKNWAEDMINEKNYVLVDLKISPAR